MTTAASEPNATTGASANRWLLALVAIAGTVTALRLAVVGFAEIDLLPDEALYWTWAQHPAVGYYSQPPLIAWIIGLATTVCGDGEACIRTPSAIIHAMTALVLYAFVRPLAKHPAEAFFVALTYLALPAVWFSATIMSTDVPLLFAWAVALLAFYRLLERRTTVWAVLTGIAIGVGLLTQYTMLYFAVCGAFLFLFAPRTRWLMWSREGAIVAGVAGLLFAPNLVWNAINAFPALLLTAGSSNWQGNLLHLGELGEFISGQFGVFGPLLFAALLAGLASMLPTTARRQRRPAFLYVYLASFCAPPLLIIAAQSFLSRTNVHWAAVSYVAGTVLVVLWLVRGRARWVVPASIALHTVAGLYIYALALGVDALPGRQAMLKQRSGWEELGQGVMTAASTNRYGAIIANEQRVMAALLYYARDMKTPLRRWPSEGPPRDHFQLTSAWQSTSDTPVLLVSRYEAPNHILNLFDQSKLVGKVRTGNDIGRPRDYYLYEAEGYPEPGSQ